MGDTQVDRLPSREAAQARMKCAMSSHLMKASKLKLRSPSGRGERGGCGAVNGAWTHPASDASPERNTHVMEHMERNNGHGQCAAL